MNRRGFLARLASAACAAVASTLIDIASLFPERSRQFTATEWQEYFQCVVDAWSKGIDEAGSILFESTGFLQKLAALAQQPGQQ